MDYSASLNQKRPFLSPFFFVALIDDYEAGHQNNIVMLVSVTHDRPTTLSGPSMMLNNMT